MSASQHASACGLRLSASQPGPAYAMLTSLNAKRLKGATMREAVIVSGARTAVGRAPRGTLRASRPDDMAAAAIREAVERTDGPERGDVEDVIIGCAMPEGTQGYNVARLSSLL